MAEAPGADQAHGLTVDLSRIETHILDSVFVLPEPPYSRADKDAMAKWLYEQVWQQRMGGRISDQGRQPAWRKRFAAQRQRLGAVRIFSTRYTEA